MQADQYRVIFGEFLIIDRQPDGDTVRFRPDTTSFLQFKDRGDALDSKDSIALRLEGIDAPETHYLQSAANEAPLATTARDRLLTLIGFDPVVFKPGDPFEVLSATTPVVGAILCRGGDSGFPTRAVAYVLTQAERTASGLSDGDEITISNTLLQKTVNYKMISEGMTYPLPFDTTPLAHRQAFTAAALTASTAHPKKGVWAVDATHSFDGANILKSAGGAAKTVLPGLFRRWIDFGKAKTADPALASTSYGQWIADSQNELLPSRRRDVTLQYPNGFTTPLSALIQNVAGTGSVTVDRPAAASNAAVYDATVVTDPKGRVVLADKKVWGTLANGEQPWMYAGGQYFAGDPIHVLLKQMAGCRASACPVPQRHPFYRNEVPPVEPAPDGSPDLQLSDVSNPSCMPVVPIRTAVDRIMFWGSFPTARFTTRIRQPAKSNQFFLPVFDIDAPLEGVAYFDGYKARDVLTAELFQREYVHGMGLDPMMDVWLTNLIKCFLFKDDHVRAYEALGWTTATATAGTKLPVDVKETAYEFLPEIADVCTKRFLIEEVDLCKPKLIVTVGAWSYGYMRDILKPPTGQPVKSPSITHIVGVPLRAGSDVGDTQDKRTAFWKKFNVMHLYHPEGVMRARDDGNNDLIARHENSLKNLSDFIDELKTTSGLVLGK